MADPTPFWKINPPTPTYVAGIPYNQIDKIPFSGFCQEPYILTSNWAPNFKSQDSIDYSFLSPNPKLLGEYQLVLLMKIDPR